MPIKKSDDELQIVWAEVYVPNVPDSDGDFMNAEEIRKMAYGFLAKGAVHQIDVQHDNNTYGCSVVESFVAREDDTIFIPDAWVVGVHVPNDVIWKMVKDGELNGFSMEAFAKKSATVLEIDIPPVVKGETDEVEAHTHSFEVGFTKDGEFLGGVTSLYDGHKHMIAKGTVTEMSAGHNHRFSVVEEMLG